MKKILSTMILVAFAAIPFTSCMNEYDDPSTETNDITSKVSIGEVNSTIGEVKSRWCASSSGADFTRNASNFFSKVNEDIVIEGVVVANDISGNLYQTVLIRRIDAAANIDECIQLAIKNTCLYPYFPLGQRLKVNLKGLYAGCYSKVPKIGQPYYTSSGNLALGPMLLQMCKTNVELVGTPDTNAPELVPVDLTDATGEAWLRASANKKYTNTPMLATVRGKIREVQGDAAGVADIGELSGEYEPLPKIFAPEVLYDAGYAVDRTIELQSNNSVVAIRTSTQNPISFMEIPTGVRSYTGMLTYYDSWQVQLRSLEDISEE
jgi:hypothetical protein